jgi:adenine-specific DNA methylase
MPAASVDAVITDPPFFDNVHYSELADFFYVWQRHFLDGEAQWRRLTTRTDGEVQHADARTFSSRLAGVFRECARVLKEDGLLVFTYHHSRAEGWTAVLGALLESGFYVTAAHPIKAEMSVGKPKHQAKEPIDIDVILVCRKRGDMRMKVVDWEDLLSEAAKVAGEQIARLNSRGMTLSRNDVRVILTAQAVRLLSRSPELLEVTEALDQGAAGIDKGIEALHAAQRPRRRTPALSDAQRRLFETV